MVHSHREPPRPGIETFAALVGPGYGFQVFEIAPPPPTY